MLRQASIREIKTGEITKKDGYLVIATRYYPRFLDRNLYHEYVSNLGPSKELMKALRDEEERICDHNKAFRSVQYERHFDLTPEGYRSLVRLIEMAKSIDVFLACYCEIGDCCHRELLLIMAKELYFADIGHLFRPYHTFQKRFAFPDELHKTAAEA